MVNEDLGFLYYHFLLVKYLLFWLNQYLWFIILSHKYYSLLSIVVYYDCILFVFLIVY